MKRLLKLHEAIAIVLLAKPDRKANYEEIVDIINQRGLYIQKSGNQVPISQIKLRTHPTTNSGKQYAHLFDFEEPDIVILKNY